MVFLPVIISLIGPPPYADHTTHYAVDARKNQNNAQTQYLEQPKEKPLENEMTVVVDGKSIGRSHYLHIAMVWIQLQSRFGIIKSPSVINYRENSLNFFNDAESLHFIPKRALNFFVNFCVANWNCRGEGVFLMFFSNYDLKGCG